MGEVVEGDDGWSTGDHEVEEDSLCFLLDFIVGVVNAELENAIMGEDGAEDAMVDGDDDGDESTLWLILGSSSSSLLSGESSIFNEGLLLLLVLLPLLLLW